MFPLLVRPINSLYAARNEDPWEPNLSDHAKRFLGVIVADPDSLFFHTLGLLNSPKYRVENAGALRQNWPRVPLPDSKKTLLASAALGRRMAALLDTEAQVKEVTSHGIRAELKPIASVTRVGSGSLKESELALKAGWGHAGKGGITMPGKGKLLERNYSATERKAVLDGARALGLSGENAFEQLGENTCDIYLNDVAYWSNIPIRVWHYTIGGYQVIKKWLSYREESLLGRPLSKDEVRFVQEMARRIAAILLLEPALDANYESVKENTYLWEGDHRA
jgi:hypothetical protein